MWERRPLRSNGGACASHGLCCTAICDYLRAALHIFIEALQPLGFIVCRDETFLRSEKKVDLIVSRVPTMLFLLVLVVGCTLANSQGAQRPLVIGHRGTAYLPELTLASQTLAHGYGADVIEIDVCLSRDNQLIVIHGAYSI